EAALANLVLEQHPQRLNQLELQVSRQPTHVVMRLDVGRARASAGLHDIGIERALNQPLDGMTRPLARPVQIACCLLETTDELSAYDLELLLRVRDSGQRGQELVAGID